MSVVVIVSDPSAGDREFATALADKLGYRCVQPEDVVERAAARGFPQQELREALEKPPGLRRFLHRPRIVLTMLRAALAEEIRQGNVVCYGNLGLLLPEIPGIAWVRVEWSWAIRCAGARDKLKLSAGEAGAWVRERDRDARQWRRWVCGPDYNRCHPGAYTVNLASLSVAEACDTISGMARDRNGDGLCQQPDDLENLALSTRVEAALAMDEATAHLDLEIRAQRGWVSVQGKLHSVDLLDDVRRVVEGVDGVTGLSLDEVGLSGDELLPSPARNPWTGVASALASRMNPRLVWITMASLAAFVISYSAASRKAGSTELIVLPHTAAAEERVWTGIITDTRCSGSHAGMPDAASIECVRRCVRTDPGARFALYDGKTLYVLADQTAGDRFAGRRVVVTGSVDKETRAMTTTSIGLL